MPTNEPQLNNPKVEIEKKRREEYMEASAQTQQASQPHTTKAYKSIPTAD